VDRSALSPLTRETKRDDGEVVREFDIVSAAVVIGAAIGVLFLLFFLASFLPWLLSRGMTAAVEGLMDRIGFGDFSADTIWDWFLVLLVFAVFTLILVGIAIGILALYNQISKRTGFGLPVRSGGELEAGETTKRAAIAEPVDDDLDDATFDELYAEAQSAGIKGRSHMSKGELRAAVRRKARKSTKTTARRRT
jgi:hypothetical protein